MSRLATVGGMLVGLAIGAVPAHANPPAINPASSPVTVVPAREAPISAQPLRLRVTLPSGVTVALTDPVRVHRLPGVLRWNGRRGRGASGPPAPDGRYLLAVETAKGRKVPARPPAVVIDRVAPRVAVVVPEPTLPRSRGPVGVRVGARDRSPVSARMIVSALTGETLAAGPWRSVPRFLPVPRQVLARGRVGAVQVAIQARDAAGNRSSSAPVSLALPGTAGPARALSRVRTSRPWVALTIDDGYDPAVVSSMVRTAQRMRAPLLLCINGAAAAGYSPALRARLRQAAHEGWIQACSHGYSHNTGADTSFAAARRDLTASIVWDRAIGQSSLPFYRPPYGAIGPGIMAAATDLGYRHVLLWDVDTNDWRHRSAQRTTAHIMGNARRGSVILMHAIPSTADALPAIITGLRARGLEPVSMGDLLASGAASR